MGEFTPSTQKALTAGVRQGVLPPVGFSAVMIRSIVFSRSSKRASGVVQLIEQLFVGPVRWRRSSTW